MRKHIDLDTPINEIEETTFISRDCVQTIFEEIVRKRKSAEKRRALEVSELLYVLARRIERDPAGASAYEIALFSQHDYPIPAPIRGGTS